MALGDSERASRGVDEFMDYSPLAKDCEDGDDQPTCMRHTRTRDKRMAKLGQTAKRHNTTKKRRNATCDAASHITNIIGVDAVENVESCG